MDRVAPQPEPYAFRSSTLTSSAKSQAQYTPPRRRNVLPKDSTSSIIRSPEHVCTVLIEDNTRAKVDMRVTFAALRFFTAHAMVCQTSRGTTRWNGAQAHCGSCQAAHASLSPTLYDDKLQRVEVVVQEQGFAHLSPLSKKYVHARFGVDTPERRRRQEESQQTDSEFFQTLRQTLPLRQQKGSFVDTELDYHRNTTITNPRGSNRLDCHLETLGLRELEDSLALECTQQVKTPQEAMKEFVAAYMGMLQKFVINIQERMLQFESFLTYHKLVMNDIFILETLTPETTTDEFYEKFIGRVRKYLELRKELKTKMPGAPNFDQHVDFFQQRPVFFPLGQLLKNFDKAEEVPAAVRFYHASKSNLRDSEIILDIERVKADLDCRLQEATVQLEKLSAINADLPSFQRLYFGVKSETGVRESPSRTALQEQLLDPIRSKRCRNLMDEISDIDTQSSSSSMEAALEASTPTSSFLDDELSLARVQKKSKLSLSQETSLTQRTDSSLQELT